MFGKGLERVVLSGGHTLRGHTAWINENGSEVFWDARSNSAWRIDPSGEVAPLPHLNIGLVFRLLCVMSIGDERFVWPKICTNS